MLRKSILLLIIILAAPVLHAAIGDFGASVGTSAVSCSDVTRSIISEWFSVKRVMSADPKSLKRPRRKDFQCVSPYYVRDLMPRATMGQQSLSCFVTNDSIGICCDKRVQSCAMLSR
jgi:hypothetical protein